ncbi:MAG: YHS domain-containing (seleno)protein [Alphaproteobacteria bacterium]
MVRFVRRLILVLGFAVIGGVAAAEKPAVFAVDGVALRGYDPVAYFAESKPVKGSPEFSFQWKGAVWHFASAANRDAFEASPEKYAPQYGGYCAFGTAQGYTVATEPDAWKIVEGKLYLNYNQSVRTRWEQDIPGFIKSADGNWPGVLKK